MYLLQGCPIITPQFASLSLLVNCNGAQKSQTSNNNNSNNGNHNYPKLLGESMLVASPIATIDQRCTMSNLAELHQYLAPKKDKNNLPKNNLCVNNSGVQVFRARHGVGLHYIAIFDRQTVQNCSSLLLSSSSSYSNQASVSSQQQQQQQKKTQHSSPKRPNKNNSKSTSSNMNTNTSDISTNSTPNSGATIYSNNINAVVLCVGLSGTSYLYSSSSLLHVLPKRLHESIPILNKIGKKSSVMPGGTHTESRRVVRSLLASLLFEDEQMNTLSSSGVVAYLLNESLLSSKYEFEKNQVMALAETDMNLKPILNLNYSKIKQQQKVQKKKKSNNNHLLDSNEQGKEETESYYYKVDTPTLPGFDDFPAPSISSSIKTIPSLGRNKRSGGSSSSLSSGPFLLGGSSAIKDHNTDQHQRPKILRRLPAPSTSDSTPSKRNYLLQKKKQMLNSERNSTLTTPSSPTKPSRRSIPQQHQQRQQKLSQANNSTQQQQGELSDTELISPVRTKDLYQGEPIKQAKSSLVSSPQPSVSKHRRTRSHGTFAPSPVKSNNDVTPEWTANFDVFNKTIPLTTTTTTKVDPLIHPMATNNNHNLVQQPQSSATSLHSLSGMEASTTMAEPPSSSNSITPKVKLPPPPPFISSSRLQRDQQKLVLNVALNEDLMCTYQQGKMFSSVIEGHVQFQLSYATHHAKPYSSSSSQQSSSLHPFTFLIKDSSRHLRAIQECMSPELFKNCSQEINKEQDHGADYKYQVQLPVSDYNNTNTITNKKRDNYTSFLKYKCSHELRPVPIVSK